MNSLFILNESVDVMVFLMADELFNHKDEKIALVEILLPGKGHL